VLLIRHASAGKRTEWEGDDRRRPLDERGREQALRLVSLLAEYAIERILSSPYDRCVQTVEPLANARGLAIEVREELGEERQAGDGAALVARLFDTDTAVCCHGGLSDALVGEWQKKGETLVLARDGTARTRVRA
jgi:broad specificity phosphatase PhoE